MHECAIFCKRVSQPFLGSLKEEDNAPRRPSEATMTSYGPKYRKFGAVGFYGGFTVFFHGFAAGKVKTSDFFETKFRCFASKVRRFMPKKSDVFAKKSPHFPSVLPLFLICFAAKTVAKCRTLHEHESVIW